MISDLAEMILGIIIGLCFLFFGIWFFLYIPLDELSGNDFWMGLNDKKDFLEVISETLVFLCKFIAGILVSIWSLFGCIGASIETYRKSKREKRARKETEIMLKRLAEEDMLLKEKSKKQEEQADDGKSESGWLW